MKLNPPANLNYAATVIRVRQLNRLPGLDNLVGLPALGHHALVSKDTRHGSLGILFVAGTQLSAEYASANNLFRRAELNGDPSRTGYLEDDARIKAIKFRGHRSDALFMPLDSLASLGVDPSRFKEGDVFDEIDGRKICWKYVPRRPKRVTQTPEKIEVVQRVDKRWFPEHFDTPAYHRVADELADARNIVVTQKLHGTSIRIGHVQVGRKLNWLERLSRRFGVKVQEREWDYVFGSRRVIKDPGNPNLPSEYYGVDLYTMVGEQYRGILPKGWILYGEIIGWVPGTVTPIQPGYTYDLPPGKCELYVYRIAVVGEDGMSADLSWEAVKEFCDQVGIKTVPQLAILDRVTDEIVESFMDYRYADTYPQAVPTSPDEKGHPRVDEGICLRVEGVTPKIVKAKSPMFFQYESRQLDEGVVDMETMESQEMVM